MAKHTRATDSSLVAAQDKLDNLVFCTMRHEVLTDSINVAEHFGKRHDHVLRDIDRLVEQMGGLPKFGETPLFQEVPNVDETGRRFRKFLMTRDGFSLLVMGFTGRKALAWKLRYIEAFDAMSAVLMEYSAMLRREREARRSMTDAIKDSGENERMHGHAYSQYTDLVYRKVTGRTAGQWRKFLGIPRNEPLKRHMPPEFVKGICDLDLLVRLHLDNGADYGRVKAAVGAFRLTPSNTPRP